MKKIIIALTILLVATAWGSGKSYEVGKGTRTDTRYPFSGLNTTKLRSQDLVAKGLIPSSKITKVEWNFLQNETTGRNEYFNFKIRLCHTNKTTLTTDFTSNYGGNTPTQTYSATSVKLPIFRTTTTWYGFQFNIPFNYNTAYNLIIEVEWNPDEIGNERYSWTYQSPKTASFLYEDSNDTYLVNIIHYMRIHLDTYSGISTSSLGRVKAIYH